MGEGSTEMLAAELNPGLPASGARAAARTGFWSALAIAILLVALNLSFAVMVEQAPAAEWQGLEAYTGAYRTSAFVPSMIGLAALPPLIVMLAYIHVGLRDSSQAWSLAELATGALSAGLPCSAAPRTGLISLPLRTHGRSPEG